MTDTLPFIQNQEYEGIQAHFTKSGVDLDISGATEITFRAFSQDYTTLKFSGTLIGDSKVTFFTDGTDGIAIYNTQTGDMDEAELLRGEFEAILGGKPIKKQGLIIKIEQEAPTS